MILYSVNDAVARITLNRPEKRNALNDELIAEIKRSLEQASDDETVRAIVITGAGKDFCSGADLSALQKIAQASMSDNADDARSLLDLFLQIRQIRVPVVAAVRGRALAGGSGLATACDLVLASEDRKSTRLNSSHGYISYAVFCLKKKK